MEFSSFGSFSIRGKTENVEQACLMCETVILRWEKEVSKYVVPRLADSGKHSMLEKNTMSYKYSRISLVTPNLWLTIQFDDNW